MKNFLLLALTGTSLLLLGQQVGASGPKVAVYNFDGQASVIRNKRTLPIELDMIIKDGDILRTEPESYIDLSLNRIAGAKLMESGEYLMESTNSSDMHIKMNFGAVIGNIRRLPTGATFKVEGPTATAVSTEGQFHATANLAIDKVPATALFVAKKDRLGVEVKKSSVTISVLEGQALDVLPSTYIPAVRNATEEELKIASAALSVYVDDSV